MKLGTTLCTIESSQGCWNERWVTPLLFTTFPTDTLDMKWLLKLVHEPKAGTVLSPRMRHDAQGLDTLAMFPAADLLYGQGGECGFVSSRHTDSLAQGTEMSST
jgi:hypothetical protein